MGAIERDGFETVKAGTEAIVAADAARGITSPPGRFLPRAAEFFDAARYRDDPAQYRPRTPLLDAGDLRRIVEDLARQVAEHPGNPANAEGSFERKAGAKAEFKVLRSELAEKRAALTKALNGESR